LPPNGDGKREVEMPCNVSVLVTCPAVDPSHAYARFGMQPSLERAKDDTPRPFDNDTSTTDDRLYISTC
jgi:hypothetical protein